MFEVLPKYVKQYVRRCTVCAGTKSGTARRPVPLEDRQLEALWHTGVCRLMDPYPNTNTDKTTILVVSDTFTKWVETIPIGDPKMLTIVRLLKE